MNIEVHASVSSVAQRGAAVIAEEAKKAIAARGRFLFAVSGGHTPWLMLAALAKTDLPWPAIHLVQVDERIAPLGDNDRNLTHLRESLSSSQLAPEQIYAMPVESPDLQCHAAEYLVTLERLAESPPVLDLSIWVSDRMVTLPRWYPAMPSLSRTPMSQLQGPIRAEGELHLQFPVINRSRQILWVVTGSDKQQMLSRLIAGDESIPAGQVQRERGLVLADNAAAGQLSAE